MSIIITATGHRPNKLGGYSPTTEQALYNLARGWLEVQLGSTTDESEKPRAVISGLALGWDTAVALAALDLNIPLIAAIPFPNQPSRWPTQSVLTWSNIKQRATKVHIISQQYSIPAMQRRNEWMVDRADTIVALWNGSPGGTANCLRYAVARNKPFDNLWNHYKDHL